MNKIIFWFSNHKTMNYWLNYTINYWNKNFVNEIKYLKQINTINLCNIEIEYKVNSRGDLDLTGLWDINQYWVEDLFDNNFEEFFWTILNENNK